MIKTMIIVLTGFLVTTGPLAILCVTSFFYNQRNLHNIMRILVVISNINSVLNPVFYFWRISYMKKNLRKFISWIFHSILTKCCCCCHNETIVSLRKRSSIGDTLFTNGHIRNQSESSISMSVKLNHFRTVGIQQNVCDSSIGN